MSKKSPAVVAVARQQRQSAAGWTRVCPRISLWLAEMDGSPAGYQFSAMKFGGVSSKSQQLLRSSPGLDGSGTAAAEKLGVFGGWVHPTDRERDIPRRPEAPMASSERRLDVWRQSPKGNLSPITADAWAVC